MGKSFGSPQQIWAGKGFGSVHLRFKIFIDSLTKKAFRIAQKVMLVPSDMNASESSHNIAVVVTYTTWRAERLPQLEFDSVIL